MLVKLARWSKWLMLHRLFRLDEMYSAHRLDPVEVVDVVDGDTIKVKFRKGSLKGQIETVRLLLVDTPESKHPKKPCQPYAIEAKAYLARKLFGAILVHLGYEAEYRDKHKRILAYVYVDRRLVQYDLVKKGLARVCYTEGKNPKIVERLRALEREARRNRKRIWRIPGYVTRNGFDSDVLGFFSRVWHRIRREIVEELWGVDD